MRYERGSVQVDRTVPPGSAREAVSVQSNNAGPTGSNTAAIQNLFRSLERNRVRYCHWKSNIRLEETLAAAEDIDLLVDPCEARTFLRSLARKWLEADTVARRHRASRRLPRGRTRRDVCRVGACARLLSDRQRRQPGQELPVADRKVPSGATRYLHGVRVPTPEAELVLFALRIALKHTGPIEILMANRHYRTVSRELGWLREAANAEHAEALCTAWFPSIDPPLFRQLLDAIEAERAVARRVVLGRRVARRLRGLRRLSLMRGAVSRLWRVLSLLVRRFQPRRDLVLQTGGMIVALVGPKATGKSTIGHLLATRLGLHLDVLRIHAGKPPATALTLLPRLLVPAARLLFSKERAGGYREAGTPPGEAIFAAVHPPDDPPRL